MQTILDSRVLYDGQKWNAACLCGKVSNFVVKNSALAMLARGTCRYCSPRHSKIDKQANIYRREDGRWCSKCSGCGREQAYTRKDHAKQSSFNDWQCRGCVAKAKGFSQNAPVGIKASLYNKYMKAAGSRGIDWDITIEEMFEGFNGQCALSSWAILLGHTASLDRIDSLKGYSPDNIQWVHTMVNMAKNKYRQDTFIEMCIAIANKVKW